MKPALTSGISTGNPLGGVMGSLVTCWFDVWVGLVAAPLIPGWCK